MTLGSAVLQLEAIRSERRVSNHPDIPDNELPCLGLIRKELIILGLHNRESFWSLNIISHAIQAVPRSHSQIFIDSLSLFLTHTTCAHTLSVLYQHMWIFQRCDTHHRCKDYFFFFFCFTFRTNTFKLPAETKRQS